MRLRTCAAPPILAARGDTGLRLTHELTRPSARWRRAAARPAAQTVHPVLRLQQAAGNRAVSRVLARQAAPLTNEQQLRAEIAAALNVDVDDPRVDVALFGDFEVARALKEARARDEAAKAAAAKKDDLPEVREDPYKGLTLEQRERKMREDAIKKELASRGITDEMLLKGYRKETRVRIGNAEGLMVDQWIPEGRSGRYVHTYELQRAGTTTRVTATTDYSKGGERTVVRTRIAGGEEVTTTTLEPGTGKLAERAALEQTTTRWVLNPDGSVTVETLDKYGRPLPGRAWKPDVLKLR